MWRHVQCYNIQCVSRHPASGTGLLWAYFGTYCVAIGFFVTPRLGVNFLFVRNTPNWCNNKTRRWSTKKGSADKRIIHRVSQMDFGSQYSEQQLLLSNCRDNFHSEMSNIYNWIGKENQKSGFISSKSYKSMIKIKDSSKSVIVNVEIFNNQTVVAFICCICMS